MAGEQVVLVPRPPLGDGLVVLPLARDLVAAGARVTVVHGHLAALARWLPDLEAVPEQAMPRGASVVVHHGRESLPLGTGSRATLVLRDHAGLHRHGPRARVLQELGRSLLELPGQGAGGALVPPGPAPTRGASRRVLLHPESGERARTWPAARFLELARRVAGRGLEPVLVLAPEEAPRWRGRAPGLALVARPDLDGVAHELLGARALVGNDSGIAHLAAALGLPAVVLFTRRRVAERWCPTGAPVEPVLPPLEVPATFLQRRLWKALVGVERVEGALLRLLERTRTEEGGETGSGGGEWDPGRDAR